jgi:signal transduction histidine kinase
VDIAIAAGLAEQNAVSALQLHITPEILVPRLGENLIEKGLLTPEGLERALNYQHEKIAVGQSCLIGQALVELGLIDRSELDQVVAEQLINLQGALQQANRQLEKRVKERTSDLQGALNKLTELNQLKTNFISSISHELRTPLTHLKGYLDMLVDRSLGPLTPQQLDALKVLQRAEERLERLIDDLIQFSLAVRGELSLQISPFQLRDLISVTLYQSKNKAEEGHITLHQAVAEGLPLTHADAEKIGWVLMQLIDNAIKFNRPGGHVLIEARQEDGLIHVSVADTGIGIASEKLSEIFEPFHQLDGSMTRRYAGTGLGLAMVRRILEAHGVPVRVHSSVGKGTRFEFSLPTYKGEYA